MPVKMHSKNIFEDLVANISYDYSEVNYIGIDPGGKTCGLAWLGDCGYVKAQYAGFIQEEKVSSYRGKLKVIKQNFVEPMSLYRFVFDRLSECDNSAAHAICCVEDVHTMPTDSKTNAFNFGRNLGTILSVLAIMEVPVIRVSPAKWKNFYWGSTLATANKATKKEESVNLALELFPDAQKWLKRKKDHNLAEALLLANYAKEQIKEIINA